jgi:hypothetical protein
MLKLEYRTISFCLSLMLLVVMALSGSGVAFADSSTATATVTAGTLMETTGTLPVPSLTIDGAAQAANYTLATTASSLTGVTAVCVGGSTCTNPTNAITYPVAVPAAGTAPTAVKFFNAAVNTGMGKFTITPTIAISLPANTFAGAYTSTITLAVVSGP